MHKANLAEAEKALAYDTISASDEQMIAFFNSNMPAGMRLLDAACVGRSQRSGELVFAFTLDGRFTNAAGFIAGGYIAQMLDQAATYAGSLMTRKASPSIDLKVSFHAPARPGTFNAVGRVVKAGSSIAFLEATLFDAARTLIASATVTAQLLPIATLIRRRTADALEPAISA